MGPAKSRSEPIPLRREVRCTCGHRVFDGVVVKSRVVRVLPIGAEALCRCKAWVRVPLTYTA
jgi:hypothetical protein